MKKFKDWIITFAIALILGLGINTFMFSSAKVQAASLTEYKMNDIVILNKMDKNLAIGNIIVFKDGKDSLIRKIVKLDNNNISVSDKNNNIQLISKSSVVGRVAFKIY